jgi:hypothetical protein
MSEEFARLSTASQLWLLRMALEFFEDTQLRPAAAIMLHRFFPDTNELRRALDVG